jgi:hypothetical protein
MSRSVPVPSIIPQYASLTAGEAITAGDLVTYEPATNTAFYADDTGLRPIWRPSPLVGYQTVAATVAENTSIINSSIPVQCATLSNGNIVIVYNTGTVIYFKIYNSSGTQVVAQTVGASLTSGGYDGLYGPSVAALSGGGFVIGRAEIDTEAAQQDIARITGFSNTGASLFSEISINSGVLWDGSTRPVCKVCATGTGFAVAYNSSAITLFSALYTSAGVRVGSLNSRNAYNFNGFYNQLQICPYGSGGYAVGSTGNTVNYTYIAFNSSSASQGTVTPISSLSNSYSGVAALANNGTNTVVAMNGPVNGSSLYYANNIQLESSGVASSTLYYRRAFDIAALTGGTFLGAYIHTTNGLTICWASSTGVGSTSNKAVIDSGATNSGNAVSVVALSNGNAGIIVTNTVTAGIELYQVTSSGSLVGRSNVATGVANLGNNAWGCNVTTGTYNGVFITWMGTVSQYPTFAVNLSTTFNVRYPYGVATASAASSATVGVQTVGAATTRLSFTTQTINSSLNNGNIVSLAGTQASMTGLTPINTRSSQQPSGVFGIGNIQFIHSTMQFTVPAKNIRVRVWGGGGGASNGGTSSFGSYVSATGGTGYSGTPSGGTGSGGDINTTGGAGLSQSYSGGGGAANYFGNGNITSGMGGGGFGGNGLTGTGGILGTTNSSAQSGVSNIGNPYASIDFIGTGPGGGSGSSTFTPGANGVNGGGGGGTGSGSSLPGDGGFPGGAGGFGQNSSNGISGGGFSLKVISDLTVGATVAVTVGTGGVATAGAAGAGGNGLVIVEW